MKKIITFCFLLFALNVNAMEKETTFKKELFDKALSNNSFLKVVSFSIALTLSANKRKQNVIIFFIVIYITNIKNQ